MKKLFIQTIYKCILSVGKHFILNLIRSYLGKLFTFLFNEYPILYRVTDYLFTILDGFHTYLYTIVFKLHYNFKNNLPILYSITVYIYSEYLEIVKGNLSRNTGVIIGLYVVWDPTYSNILLFALLLLNVFFKKYLVKDIWLKDNFPLLY